MTGGFFAPELRLFNLSQRFQNAYQNLRWSLRSQELEILRNQSLVRLAAKGISLLIGGIALAWMSLYEQTF